jgi:Pro-kumamolisin, activation domain
MHSEFGFISRWFALPILLLALNPTDAQLQPEPTRRLITQTIDNNKRVTLAGNTRPEASPTNDRGRVPTSLPMEHLQITLRLPQEKQAELDRFLNDAQDSKSPSYHKWLTPQEFKQKFSLAPQDTEAISEWLRFEGFRVNAINPTAIDFSGTAGQVEHAFRTQIHYLDVKGAKHIANMHDPQIPEALAPAVSGIVSLNDFKPRPLGRSE